MARRNLIDIDNKIINAVYKIGAEYGIHGITSAKVAALCDISHFTCFEHFGTMKGLLDTAAQQLDRKYMAMVSDLIAEGLTLHQVFNRMLTTFLQDPDGTLFYNNYTLEFGFNTTTANARSAEFLACAKLIIPPTIARSDNEYLYLFDYLTSMCFYYAEKLLHNYMPNTSETIAFIENLVFFGISKS